jgi:hypothetical protein
MACTKAQLISAINSFGAARAAGDGNLIQFAADLIGQCIETLEFAPEKEEVVEEEMQEEVKASACGI